MNSLYQLFIDVTSKKCVLAIYKNFKILANIIVETNNNLTDIIVEHIIALLKAVHLKYQDLDAIYLDIGPGSFTGVRVGAIVAKTICTTHNQIKLFINDSLNIIANNQNNVFVHLDAKGNKSYTISIINNIQSDYRIITNEQLQIELKNTSLTIIDANQVDYHNLIYNLKFDNFKLTNILDFDLNYVKKPLS
ncbi:tRNA (adenosine(37)-N6)-threonylcarbamoyltransferase complex dimerization subunit type 1 TsaB [Ureaplasma urealyticum]|uniref:tRNA (adenosine(37)-N6)-threonylcarbamoyltransferase complex dimerization subunit type 1 TsaB n=1 Tax=Ureaplasma urealyticum TaxID=2130 RepID=UPI00016C2ACC|nr:tRNA (adenosine(37)-N6)-threonylcarbamoyltransferase complex dimerization subunit type 1 TsaB [Ureaplasma urealyticum]EEH01974.1 glycoprotease family protein [Ureaplasma urealyticum serovar 2 str. ATCC 27814]